MSWFVPVFDVWLHVTIAGLALTAAASLAVLFIGEPARRIRVIQLALVGLLVLPALVLLPGYPRVALRPTPTTPESDLRQPSDLPAGSPAASSASDTSAAAAPSDPDRRAPAFETLPSEGPSPAWQPSALPGGSPSAPRENTNSAGAAPSAVPAAVPTAPAPRAHSGFTRPTLPDYRLLIVSAYLLGVSLFAFWWFIGRIALWRLLHTATPADPSLRAILDDIAKLDIVKEHAASSARVRLLVSPRAAQPCAFGILRPTIVLPERVVKELTYDQLRLALSHEWSHVVGGDIRTWMLAGVVRLVHFHQPLVWLLRRELRISQDYLADAAAAGASTPEDYAELLTTLSRILRPTPLSPGLGIAPRRSELYKRVVMLVDHTRPLERTIPRRWNLAIVSLGLALIAGAATLRAEPEESKPASSESSVPSVASEVETKSPTPATASAVAPSPTGPKTRHPLLDDPTDRRDIALRLVTVRRDLENALKARKDLQSRLSHAEQNSVEYRTLERHLAIIDEAVLMLSPQLADIQAHFDEASLKEYGRAYVAVADWEHAGDKRRLLESLFAELDQCLARRESLSQEVAEQTDSKLRKPLETEIDALERQRVRIGQRIEEVLKTSATGRPAAAPRAALISRIVSDTPRPTPFSGRIRPGDIIGIELTGGFPTPLAPTRTVEPDGNLPLGSIYGPASRVKVAGLTLIEAGQTIEKQLKEILKDPHVLLTYQGHDNGIVPEGTPTEAASTPGRQGITFESATEAVDKSEPATNPIILQPLDTIEVILPLKIIRSHIKEVDGKPTEVTTGDPPAINGTYLIEPDGRIALPQAAGRLALAGLTEEAAGEKLREHLAKTVFPRKALPTTRVLRRGRAIFADGKQPAADYKIQPGDALVLRSDSSNAWGTGSESLVDTEGNFGWGPRIKIAGLTLEEAQRAFRKEVKVNDHSQPWLITLGGWREEADPRVIDRIEGTDATQLLRMQEEMQELKAMIRRLQTE